MKMMKPGFAIAALTLIGAFAAAAPASRAQAPSAPGGAGFDLLDHLIVAVIKGAAPGGNAGNIGADIIELAKELKSARESKKVDDLFAVRYSRLLSAVRQSLLMDPEALYWPMYRFSMMDFIEERTGKMPEWRDVLFIVNDHGGAGIGLGMIADAVISEVVSLHIYLETLDKRPDLLKSYLDKGLKAAGAEK